MKYKLLNEKGVQFVCFEDGVKIPYQVSTTAFQRLRDPALVTVEAILGDRMGLPTDKKLLFKDGELYFDGVQLLGVSDIKVFKGPETDPRIMHTSFSVECEVGDTIEKPKNANY